ncbi:MAG: Trk system potassium transporter TrkA [Clostridiales bacterium]|jgi:trk system potassium uptake protein TrkA|nr:Trk system potassium transporter TrkA [Clostridiales bacterium]
MKIIIIGDGKVGNSLAENLAADGDNSITIIDKNAEALRKTVESLDVRCVKGNGVSAGVLLEAGVAETDLLIAATSSDEMNMVCCLTAKKLGAEHTIARIRDPAYADELSLLKADLGLDMVINPEQAVAGEIAKLLGFPSAMNVEMFAKGRVEMAEIKAAGDLAISGMAIRDIAGRISPSILVGAILRGDEIIIPNGGARILEGDSVYLIGHPSQLLRFCGKIGMQVKRIRNVMIVGGGRIAYYLALYLDEIDIKAKIIEIDYGRCLELSELLPGALVINGDGSDDKMLRSENLGEMDGFVSVTGIDEENLMTALLAKRCGVHKVIAKINRTGYTEVINGMGLDSLVRPKLITANHILRYVRGMQNAMGNPVNTLYRIIGGNAEIIEFTADSSTAFLDVPLRKLRLAEGALVACIVRKNETIIPHGNDAIRLHDSVILITKGLELSDLNSVIQGAADGREH